MEKNMTSHNLIDMTPDEFVGIKDIDSKIMAIDNLIEAGYDLHPEILHWFKVVLLKEKETGLYDSESESPGAELLLRLIQAVGNDVHEKDVRDLLSKLFLDSRDSKGLFHVIERILIAAIQDELNEVRIWALNILKTKGRIKNSTEIQTYLISILEGESPYYLKEEAIVALSHRGTEQAIRFLLYFAKKLLGSPQKGLYERTRDNVLKEKVAYSLGLTGNPDAIKTLTALQIFTDDRDVKGTALLAIERIKESPVKAEYKLYKLAANGEEEALKLDKKTIMDNSETYEFEIARFPDKETLITLISTIEPILPDQLKLKIFTGMKENPILECILEKDEKDFEVYAYVSEPFPFEKIEGIVVEPHETV